MPDAPPRTFILQPAANGNRSPIALAWWAFAAAIVFGGSAGAAIKLTVRHCGEQKPSVIHLWKGNRP